MAERLRHQSLDEKVRGLIPGCNPLCSCQSGGSNIQIQAHGVHFHRLPSCLSDEMLKGGPESFASVVLASRTKHFPLMISGWALQN